jgi:peptide/nickel transport system permease protein
MSAIVNEHDSAGLWTLAWRRLREDRIAMAALAVVAAFLVMLILSATGLVAADWEDEVAVNYAPPGFIGPDPALAALSRPPAPTPPNAFDPLAGDLAELKAELASHGHAAQVVKAST